VNLDSAKTTPKQPLLLENLNNMDFRVTHLDPLEQLIWGITGKKPARLSNVSDSEKPATMREADKGQLLPSGDEHAVIRKYLSAIRDCIRPSPSRLTKSKQPNSKFFAAESKSTG
jgi:hypothetical protein